MATMSISFDTHKFVKDLREAGIPEPQAEAFVRAQQEILAQALDNTLATKGDISELTIEMTAMRGDVSNIKWMMGALIALAVANFSKQFF